MLNHVKIGRIASLLSKKMQMNRCFAYMARSNNKANANMCEVASVKDALDFLSEYAVLLFGSGATCVRLQKNMKRIAAAFGMQLAFSVLPQHLHITLRRGDEVHTSVATIRELPISFAKIAALSKLSWQMADGREGFDCAWKMLDKIRRERVINPLELTLMVSAANASFCRLFSGDWVAMLIVFCATVVGFTLKLALFRRHLDYRIVVFVCAFVSALITSLDGFFGIGSTPGVAVATSVLYLIPGIPLINSFCDLIGGHYLCCLGRAAQAAMVCVCITAGLMLAMMVMHTPLF